MREPVLNPGGLQFLLAIVAMILFVIFWRDVYGALFSVLGQGATVLVIAVWLYFIKRAWTDDDTVETRETFIGLRQLWRRMSGSGTQILPPEKEPASPQFGARLSGPGTDSPLE